MANSSSGPDFLKGFKIPKYVVVAEPKSDGESSEVPECPVLVFINSKSGGQLGGHLLVTYRQLLNDWQLLADLYVFDVGEEAPDKVLRRIYVNLETLKRNGDEFAAKIQEKLRLIVAGGDGTAGWLFGVVSDLKFTHSPPIATVPLGNGNNLPFAFGWDGFHTFRGGFWNYFSMGMDAEVSYAFHSERKLNPEKFKNQFVNQSTYTKLGCSQGWFSPFLSQNSAR